METSWMEPDTAPAQAGHAEAAAAGARLKIERENQTLEFLLARPGALH